MVRITDLSRNGPGVARDPEGRVVFVPWTAPGDLVRVRVMQEEKRYAEAELLEVVEAGEGRVPARCPAFARCGGCDWQHLPYETQWRKKVEGVKHSLTRIGINPEEYSWQEFPAEKIWNYRNRVQLRVQGDRAGFRRRASTDMVPVEECHIARVEINEALAQLKGKMPAPRRGHDEQKLEIEVFEDGRVSTLWNQRHSASGFRQVHDEQNEKLRSWVACELKGTGVLWDLYGGSGNLSLGLKERFQHVHCVDVTSPMENSSGKITYHRGDVALWLKTQKNPGAKLSVILDPPREGLGKDLVAIVERLKACGAEEILLVGCDAVAWARDLHRFLRHGWKAKSLGVLDFFPQTHHVESLAVLSFSP